MKVSRIPEVPESDGNSPLMIGGNVTRQAITPDVESFNCAIVNFSKGARNKFHAHSGDQVLIITSGIGIVATDDEQVEVRLGDVIHIPAGEKHWHGARAESAMSHITVTAKDSQTETLE